MLGLSRREFMMSGAGVASLLILGAALDLGSDENQLLRPPGAQDFSTFVALCIKCGRCCLACPRACLIEATLERGLLNARTPCLDFHKGYCDFCGLCAQVCPTGAVMPRFDLSTAKIGTAVIDEDKCLAFQGGGCKKCVEACPFGAISWSNAFPLIDTRACKGCGLCENICPSNSLRSFSGSRDRRGINVAAESKA